MFIEVHKETHPSSDHSCHIYLVLRTVLTVVMVALLLLLVGLLHCGKLGGTKNNSCPLTCKCNCQTKDNNGVSDRED